MPLQHDRLPVACAKGCNRQPHPFSGNRSQPYRLHGFGAAVADWLRGAVACETRTLQRVPACWLPTGCLCWLPILPLRLPVARPKGRNLQPTAVRLTHAGAPP
jgi:hypothetical protein